MQFAEVYMDQSSQTIWCAINQASISFKRLKSYKECSLTTVYQKLVIKEKKLGDFRRQSDTLNMGQKITREIRKYLNENENTTKTWDAAKIFVRDQFIAVNIYILKKEHLKSIT